jgi:hypothetical protein
MESWHTTTPVRTRGGIHPNSESERSGWSPRWPPNAGSATVADPGHGLLLGSPGEQLAWRERLPERGPGDAEVDRQGSSAVRRISRYGGRSSHGGVIGR